MRPSNRSRRGFTLIEAAVASGVSAVLMLSLGSTVLIASRAVPTADEPLVINARVDRAVSTLRADIADAIDIRTGGDDLILAVPDRDRDGRPEAIHYSVSAEGMLTRSVNQGAAFALAGPVADASYVLAIADGRVDRVHASLKFVEAEPAQRRLVVRLLNRPEAR